MDLLRIGKRELNVVLRQTPHEGKKTMIRLLRQIDIQAGNVVRIYRGGKVLQFHFPGEATVYGVLAYLGKTYVETLTFDDFCEKYGDLATYERFLETIKLPAKLKSFFTPDELKHLPL